VKRLWPPVLFQRVSPDHNSVPPPAFKAFHLIGIGAFHRSGAAETDVIGIVDALAQTSMKRTIVIRSPLEDKRRLDRGASSARARRARLLPEAPRRFAGRESSCHELDAAPKRFRKQSHSDPSESRKTFGSMQVIVIAALTDLITIPLVRPLRGTERGARGKPDGGGIAGRMMRPRIEPVLSASKEISGARHPCRCYWARMF